MKTLNIKLLPLMLMCAFANTVHAGDEGGHSCSIDWTMRKEMFLLGSFHVKEADGRDRGTFLVNYLPGADNIMHDAGKHWVHAAKALAPFLEGEKFWKNEIWGSFTGGLLWGWNTNAHCGIGAIPQDFAFLWKDFNSVKVTEFGAVGHKALDCLGAVASVVCRSTIGVASLVGGVAAGIVVPPLKMAGKVCHALGEATVCGAGWPMLKMIWNGAAWVGTQLYARTPDEASNLIVTWVPSASNLPTCSTRDGL